MKKIFLFILKYKKSLRMKTEKNSHDHRKQICDCIIGAKKKKKRIDAITESSIYSANKNEADRSDL